MYLQRGLKRSIPMRNRTNNAPAVCRYWSRPSRMDSSGFAQRMDNWASACGILTMQM